MKNAQEVPVCTETEVCKEATESNAKGDAEAAKNLPRTEEEPEEIHENLATIQELEEKGVKKFEKVSVCVCA